MASKREELEAILERVRVLEGPCREIDACLGKVLGDPLLTWGPFEYCPYTACRDGVDYLFEKYFPGWWWSGGSCALTGHASCGPDYNDPKHRERLFREWPEGRFDDGLHEDLTAGSGRTRATRALLCVFLQALIAREEMRETALAEAAT